MNQLSALYFPETSPDRQTVCQLLLFFEQLYYYNPAETATPSALRIFADNDLIVGYPPLPFGNDLPRFQRMLRDLKGSWGEFYRSSLSSMAVEQFRVKDKDEASTWSLKSSMTASADSRGDIANKEAVWQAALLLKLSELLTQEEQEIAEGLSNIAIKQSQMLEALRGNEETALEESLPTLKPLLPTASPISIGLHTKAWGQLYLRDITDHKKQILATSRPEAADLLIDAYEALARKRPITLCRLALPATGEMSDDDYFSKRQTLHQTSSEDLHKIASAFGQIINSAADSVTEESTSALQHEVARWASFLNDNFAEHSAGISTLTIYLLAGTPLFQVFAKLCQASPKELTNTPEPGNGMLAVLTPYAGP